MSMRSQVSICNEQGDREQLGTDRSKSLNLIELKNTHLFKMFGQNIHTLMQLDGDVSDALTRDAEN